MRQFSIFLTASLLASPVLAHTGVSLTSAMSHGFLHPLTGPDHLMAMVAVGLFAANLGGRAVWAVPLAFMGLMVAGGAAGMAGWQITMVEAGIATSVLVLGLVLAFNMRASVQAAMLLVGVFAFFHGVAHGAEMPSAMSGAEYGLGFLLATGLLHVAGLGFGILVAPRAPQFLRALGATFACAGAGFLAGVF